MSKPSRMDRVKGMKAERSTPVKVSGIAPYTIDKVDGRYLVEFRQGSTEIPVVAFDVRCPDGSTKRYCLLREARAAAEQMAAERLAEADGKNISTRRK